MATLDTTRTSAFLAASRVLDQAIEAALEHRPTHASGTTFVPADIAGSGRIAAYRRLGPVSVVDADGNEIRLPQDRTLEIVLGVVAVGVLAWALSRRSLGVI